MQAVVNHDQLGPTALFGSVNLPIAAVDGVGYRLDDALDLHAPDFALTIPAQPALPDPLPATLRLRNQAQLPFELPILPVDLKYQISDRFTLVGLDRLQIPIAGDPAAVGAFRLHPSTLGLSIGVDSWQAVLTASTATSPTIASVHIGAIEFHVTQLAFTESGVTLCEAAIKPGSVAFAGQTIEVVSGNLTVRGKRISAVVEARLSITGFQHSRVDLTITASGAAHEPWRLNAVARAPTIDTWTDPSGYLRFENMSLSWLLEYDSATNAVTGQLNASGRMQFLGDKLSGAAREWLGELFGGLSADFADVRLGAWTSPDFLAFRPLSRLNIKALDIFDMQIPSIGVSSAGLVLGDLTLAFRGGGASIRAALPRLSLKLDSKEIVLALDGSKLSLNVELTVASGIKAYGTLNYKETSTMQALSGAARFSTPTLPGVEVMFEIGRARLSDTDSTWHPLLLLYADIPANLPVFPGVVIQRLALGAGLNYAVAGVTGLSFAQAEERVRSGGLPDVSQATNWVPRPGSFTLAARAFAGSTPNPDERPLQLYIADLTFIMASDLQLAAYLKMWFQTSLADARNARFQEKPAVVALATFDGNEPSLRLIAMSKPDGLSSQAESGETGGLLTFRFPEARLAFEANARGMAVVIGPNKLQGNIGPLTLSAQTMLALRAVNGEVFVVYRNALDAGLHIAGSLDLGLVRFSASVTAAFSANVELWGLFENSAVTVYGKARATFLVDVALHVRIGFRIEISYGFGSIEIECYQHWDFGLRVHIDLSLEVAMSTDRGAGVVGHGTVGVSVLGMTVSITLPLEVAGATVSDAKERYMKKIAPHLDALGAQ